MLAAGKLRPPKGNSHDYTHVHIINGLDAPMYSSYLLKKYSIVNLLIT